MSLLDSLPLGVLKEIGPQLEAHDVANPRLACTRISRLFAPYLVDTVVLEIRRTNIVPNNLLMRACVDRHKRWRYALMRPLFIFHKIYSHASEPSGLRVNVEDHPEGFEECLDQMEEDVPALTPLREFGLVHRQKLVAPGDVAAKRSAEERLLSAVFQGNDALDSVKPLESFLSSPLLAFAPLPLPFTMPKHLRLVHASKDTYCLSQAKDALARGSCLQSLSLNLRTPDQLVIQDMLPPRWTISYLPLQRLLLDGNFVWSNERHINIPSFTHLRRLIIAHPQKSTELDGFWDVSGQ